MQVVNDPLSGVTYTQKAFRFISQVLVSVTSRLGQGRQDLFPCGSGLHVADQSLEDIFGL